MPVRLSTVKSIIGDPAMILDLFELLLIFAAGFTALIVLPILLFRLLGLVLGAW